VARRSRIAVRGGVHIGECDLSAGGGPILNLSARLADAAGAGEVCVSRTIVDLVHGSGLEFCDRGTLAGDGLAHEIPMLKVV
jgi:class 3 adenylate cyclase